MTREDRDVLTEAVRLKAVSASIYAADALVVSVAEVAELLRLHEIGRLIVSDGAITLDYSSSRRRKANRSPR